MRSRTTFWTTALVLVIGVMGNAKAQDQKPAFDQKELAKIAQRMQGFVEQGKISGAVTLVATANGVVHCEAVGKADREAGREMDKEAIFRVASMTKTVTAAALMMLVEEGKVKLDDPVAKYIPAFADLKMKDGSKPRTVTLADVLTHTAGISQPPRDDKLSLAQLCDAVAEKPLAFAPGAQWQYSSGLTVAGRVIEVVSGQRYQDFLQQRIFQPLGMKDTAFHLTAEQAQRVAVNYQPGDQPGALKPAPGADPTVERTPNPSGGLYSTAGDMAKFYQAVLQALKGTGERPLWSAKTVKDMTANHTPGIVTGFTPGNTWGWGWCVVQQPQGVSRLLSPGTFGHGGAWGTQAWVDPQRGLVLLLMIQRSGFGNSDGSDVRDAMTEAAVKAYRGVEQPSAKFQKHRAYDQAVVLSHGNVKAVLCPQVGGRVLEFSVDGKDALYLDPKEDDWKPGQAGAVSAGRFDVGPELTVKKHPRLWSGAWTAEIVGPGHARLISENDLDSGMQLIRDFTLSVEPGLAPRLCCRQTIANTSSETLEVCHWGRSFSPGGGLVVIPLEGPSRFPSRYALYEDSAVINVSAVDDNIRERDGCLEILAAPRKPKLGFDSRAGWLAYVAPSGAMLVKRFPVDADRVYNEAAGLTLSVWYPAGPRVELEPIGPRERLAPGQTASFTEDWWLSSFPFPSEGRPADLGRLKDVVSKQTKAPE